MHRDGRAKAALVLVVLGSVLNLVTGAFILLLVYLAIEKLPHVELAHHLGPMSLVVPPVVRAILPLMAVITLAPGVLGLVSAILIMYGRLLAGGLLAIVAALASVPIALGSMLVGFVAMIAGGILALGRS